MQEVNDECEVFQIAFDEYRKTKEGFYIKANDQEKNKKIKKHQ